MDERGNLRDREVFGPSRLGKGAWPDRIAFDSYGNLWGTLVYSDKLFVLTPDGDMRVLLDEGDPVKVDALEQAFFRNHVTEDVLFATGQGVAPWMASVTFGGPDLRTVYIGSLKGQRIGSKPYFRAPVRWPADGALARAVVAAADPRRPQTSQQEIKSSGVQESSFFEKHLLLSCPPVQTAFGSAALTCLPTRHPRTPTVR